MPVASASKKNNQKRIQLTDTDGWTHIVKGSQAQTRQKHLTPVDKLQPTAVSKGWTIPRGCDMLERYRKTIKDSQLLAQVNGILESQVFVAVAVSITRCVCLGLGSMTGQTGNEESSWHQLAFLVSLVEILSGFSRMHHFPRGEEDQAKLDTGKRYMIETIYVQDPTFNRVDMALLKRVGCTVLESPDAFDRMTSDTFLFDPHLEWKHTVRALDVAHPSLRIGNTIDSDLFW